MKRATPYLFFPGHTEEAFAFYGSVFGGDEPRILRNRDMGMDGPDGDLVAHVSLKIADETSLMGSDVAGPQQDDHRIGTNVEIHLAPDDADEARRVFAALAEGGTIAMPLERTSWSELFGGCVDRYGVRWIVDFEGSVQFGAP
jgi:PhnB protein